jgi:hypothetical protein
VSYLFTYSGRQILETYFAKCFVCVIFNALTCFVHDIIIELMKILCKIVSGLVRSVCLTSHQIIICNKGNVFYI